MQKAESFTFAAESAELRRDGNKRKGMVEEFTFEPQADKGIPKLLQSTIEGLDYR